MLSLSHLKIKLNPHLSPFPDELTELPLDHVPPLHVEVFDHLGVEVAVHVFHHAVTHHLVCSGLQDLQKLNTVNEYDFLVDFIMS